MRRVSAFSKKFNISLLFDLALLIFKLFKICWAVSPVVISPVVISPVVISPVVVGSQLSISFKLSFFETLKVIFIIYELDGIMSICISSTDILNLSA